MEVRACPARDVVHQSPLVVPGDDLRQLGDRRERLGRRVRADSQPDDEVVATALADPPQDLGREAHPVLERAAPLVGPPVRPRRPELVDQGVVCREDLDAIEPALLRALRRGREPFDRLLDLVGRHRMTAVGVVIRGQR